MYKKILQEDLDKIIQSLFEIKAPIKMYAQIKDLFDKLPIVEEKSIDKKITE